MGMLMCVSTHTSLLLLPLLLQTGATRPRQSATDLYSEGTLMLNRGALLEAESKFDAALAASGDHPMPHLLVNRALTLARMGRPEVR